MAFKQSKRHSLTAGSGIFLCSIKAYESNYVREHTSGA